MFISKTNRKKFQKTLHDSGFLWTISLILDRFGFRPFRFWPNRTIAPEVLSSQITAILRALGMAEEDKVILQAGAGIVADSVKESEYQEVASKLGALVHSLEDLD